MKWSEGAGIRLQDFRIEGSRLEAADDDREPEHQIGFRLTARW